MWAREIKRFIQFESIIYVFLLHLNTYVIALGSAAVLFINQLGGVDTNLTKT